MWERGIFGLLQRGFLRPEARSDTIRDIARPLADGTITDGVAKIAERVLSSKLTERAQILRLLLNENVSSAQLAHLGL